MVYLQPMQTLVNIRSICQMHLDVVPKHYKLSKNEQEHEDLTVKMYSQS